MGLRATSSVSASLPLGGLWTIEVEYRDFDGYLASATPTVVVTLPGGTTTSPTFSTVETGIYRATYKVGSVGRYVAIVSTDDDAVYFSAYVSATTAATGMPVLADVTAYLGSTSYTNTEIQEALDAEAAAQRAVCRIGAVYSADLREALLRRVARNLAMRQLPLSVLQGDAELGGGVLPGRDPEVRRLEAPYRRLVVG